MTIYFIIEIPLSEEMIFILKQGPDIFLEGKVWYGLHGAHVSSNKPNIDNFLKWKP